MKTVSAHRCLLQKEVMADMCYLCLLWPSRRDQIKLAWDRRTKPVFIQVSLSLSLSLDLAFSFPPPSQSLSWKGRENQGQANEHVKLQENKFPHTCPFRPTDSLKECSLVKPGNIWLVKTYGMFTWGPRLQSTFPFLSPLTHSNPRRKWRCLIHDWTASPHCPCLSRGESN